MRWLISAGHLRSDDDSNRGYALYSEEQVQMLLLRKRDGSLLRATADWAPTPLLTSKRPTASYGADEGIRVFEELEKNTPAERIPGLARIHPQVVDQIRHDYEQLSGSMTIPKAILDQINRLKNLPGSFPLRSPTDLLVMLQKMDRAVICRRCGRARCALECPSCVREIERELVQQQQQAAAAAAAAAATAAAAARVAAGPPAPPPSPPSPTDTPSPPAEAPPSPFARTDETAPKPRTESRFKTPPTAVDTAVARPNDSVPRASGTRGR